MGWTDLNVGGVRGVDGDALGHQHPHHGRQVADLGQCVPVRLAERNDGTCGLGGGKQLSRWDLHVE